MHAPTDDAEASAMTWLEGSKVPGGAEKKFFISYASEDVFWAETARVLRASGISVFWAEKSLRAGDAWPDELRAAVAEADVVKLGWSEHASRSAWVKAEYSGALAKGRTRFRSICWTRILSLPTSRRHRLSGPRSARAWRID